jgi:hypothetical protein
LTPSNLLKGCFVNSNPLAAVKEFASSSNLLHMSLGLCPTAASLKSEVLFFRLAIILVFKESRRGSSFVILGGELFRMPADTRIGMLQEPIEGFSLLSADDAFPGDKTIEVSQILPVLQLGASEFGTILAEMARMAGSRESLIRENTPAAPAKMSLSPTLLCHGLL